MIQVYIDAGRDFGRALQIVVVEQTVGDYGKISEHAIVPVGEGQYKSVPMKEGQRITPEMVFMELPQFMGNEFLRAMVVELARLGYVTPDPHGTKARAMDEHLATLKQENDRKFELLNKTLDALVAPKVAVKIPIQGERD
jgi:hypothetical protein